MIGKSMFDDMDTGVSPVVGVILMVAVTVILAAVIGTFVLDLGGNVSQNAQAGVTFDEEAGTDGQVTVQTVSVQQADSITVQNTGDTISNVGDTAVLQENDGGDDDYDPGDTITVVATLDGETSVIQTYETQS